MSCCGDCRCTRKTLVLSLDALEHQFEGLVGVEAMNKVAHGSFAFVSIIFYWFVKGRCVMCFKKLDVWIGEV